VLILTQWIKQEDFLGFEDLHEASMLGLVPQRRSLDEYPCSSDDKYYLEFTVQMVSKG
jgi:hypothetical protein